MRSRITSSFGPRWLSYTITWTHFGRRLPRSRFRSLTYWLFGAWLLEACFWLCVLGGIATWYAVKWITVLLVWACLVSGELVSSIANWWFDHRAEERAREH